MLQNKINSLQMLRAIAVILVMFFHITYFNTIAPHLIIHPAISDFFYIRAWGAIGVDIFFSISGFIMSIILPVYIDNNQWKHFLLKRVIRIVPLYFLISFFFILYSHHHQIHLSKETLLKTFTIVPVFDTKLFVTPVNSVGWTLAYEMYFYLLITTFLLFKKNVVKRLLICILLLSFLAVLFNPDNVILKFITSPLLLEFALGIACGLIYKKRHSFKILHHKGFVISLLAISIILSTVTIFTGTKGVFLAEPVINNNYDALFRVAIWGIPTSLLLLAIVLAEYAFNWTVPWWLILFGDASYSAYLLHVYIYSSYGEKIYRHINWGDGFFILTAIPFTLIVTALFYNFIERPMTLQITQLVFKKQK